MTKKIVESVSNNAVGGNKTSFVKGIGSRILAHVSQG